MKQLVVVVVAGVFLLGAGVAPAAAQPTKSVSGMVTAVGPDSVTVKVKDSDMKFVVDQTTEVLARGGTTATRAAKAEGKAGPKISEVVKTGQNIEVKYHEAGMHAANIRVLASAAPAPAATTGQDKEKPKAAPKDAEKEKSKSSTASGTVTSMTGTSLTLKTSTGEQTFTVDANSKVIGSGLGTKAKEAAAAGKKQVLSDTVAVGDTVAVTYHEAGGAKQASEVRVRQKAAKK